MPFLDHAVLFDADGVLMHSYNNWNGQFYWAENLMSDLGIPPEVHHALFTEGWDNVLRGKEGTRQHVQKIFDKYKVKTTVDRYLTYWLDKDRNVNEAVACFLSPQNSFIATNQDALRGRELVRLFDSRVSKIYLSCSIGAIKPEANYFAYIERDLGLPPEKLWFIDDHEANIEAAHQRGWRTHHFSTPGKLAPFLSGQAAA